MTDSPNIRRMRRHVRLGYLLDSLERMRLKPENLSVGICCNLPINLRGEVLAYAKTWPRHTGDLTFPVPHPHADAETAYKAGPMWEGEYGDNRRALLDYLIEAVRKDLDLANANANAQAAARAAFSAVVTRHADTDGAGSGGQMTLPL